MKQTPKKMINNYLVHIRSCLVEYTLIVLLTLSIFILVNSAAEYQQQCNDYWIKELTVNGMDMLITIRQNNYNPYGAPMIQVGGIPIITYQDNYTKKEWDCSTPSYKDMNTVPRPNAKCTEVKNGNKN
jgi:hypothetical protein